MTTHEQQKFYTADELLELSSSAEYRDMRLELAEGELIVMSPSTAQHGNVSAKFIRYIDPFVEKNDLGYTTTAEAGYILYKNPNGKDTVYAPDVGFVAKERLPDGLPDTYIPFAPDLAVEVVSKNDSAEEIDEKVANYLKYGTRMVIVAYPKTRRILVHTPENVIKLEEDDILDGGDVLPDFTLAVRDVFPKKQ